MSMPATVEKAKSIDWRTPTVVVVCGCLIAMISFGPRSSLGFFLTPLSQTNHWGRDVFAFAETVMLGQITVKLAIARDGDAHCGGDQPMRLTRRGLRHDHERDLAGLQPFGALGARQDPAVGREDARDAHQIAGGDARGAQRQLERRQLFAVLADTLREKHLLGDESDHFTLLMSQGTCMVNTPIASVKERTGNRDAN